VGPTATSPRLAASLASWLTVGWKPYELAWLLTFGAVAAAVALHFESGPFALSVNLCGILCVVLAAKGHILNYAVGIYNCVGYGIISVWNGLYGEAGLNLLFFAPMAAVGILVWRKNLAGSRVRMRRLGGAEAALMWTATAACTAALGAFLAMIPTQNTPYVDAATNVLSIATTMLMIWRYREQWQLYVTLDVLTVAMWSARAAAGSQEGAVMVVMWSAYLVNAVYGWRVWNAGARADATLTSGGVAEAPAC
jgi:nicotinamide mononucleotide transporter